MKYCPNCHNQLKDDAVFCPHCGTNTAGAPQPPQNGYQPMPNYGRPAPMYDPYDHTAEFDPQDISDNKVICMLVYLMGVVGIFIALLASSTSKYAAFHVRQALKFTVVNTLVMFVSALLCWTFIVPIAAAIFICVLSVIKIICFFQICSGKAKEPAIIRSLGFLR